MPIVYPSRSEFFINEYGDGTAEWWGNSGSACFPSGSVYPVNLQQIPISKSGIVNYKCKACGRKFLVDYDKTGAVFVLECPSCNCQELEMIR